MSKRLKNTALYALVVVVYAVVRRLPLAAALAVGRALGELAFVLAAHERRVALRNLARVFPTLDERARRAMARAMFVNLGRSALECATFERLAPRLDELVSFAPGAERALREARAEGRGVIFVSGHIGNWELLAAHVARVGAVSVLAKPSYDPRLTRLIERIRGSVGVRNIWVDGPAHLRQAVRALRGGVMLGVLVDQPVAGGEPLPFFGEPAPTSAVVAMLARATGAPTVAGFIRRVGPGRHVVDIARLDLAGSSPADEASVGAGAVASVGTGRARALVVGSEVCNRAVEQAIERAPSQWAWSLDRWRDGDRNRAAKRAAPDPQSGRASTNRSDKPSGLSSSI